MQVNEYAAKFRFIVGEYLWIRYGGNTDAIMGWLNEIIHITSDTTTSTGVLFAHITNTVALDSLRELSIPRSDYNDSDTYMNEMGIRKGRHDAAVWFGNMLPQMKAELDELTAELRRRNDLEDMPS